MVAVGNIVKCLDFPERDDCFLIGKVIAVEDDFFRVEVALDVKAGDFNHVRVGGIYKVPNIGKALIDDAEYPGRVVVLCAPVYVD